MAVESVVGRRDDGERAAHEGDADVSPDLHSALDESLVESAALCLMIRSSRPKALHPVADQGNSSLAKLLSTCASVARGCDDNGLSREIYRA
jgi:hypothetical protein